MKFFKNSFSFIVSIVVGENDLKDAVGLYFHMFIQMEIRGEILSLHICWVVPYLTSALKVYTSEEILQIIKRIILIPVKLLSIPVFLLSCHVWLIFLV